MPKKIGELNNPTLPLSGSDLLELSQVPDSVHVSIDQLTKKMTDDLVPVSGGPYTTRTETAQVSANTLNQSNLYTDTQSQEASANALTQANNYTDTEILALSASYDEHNELKNIQGGIPSASEYYHVSQDIHDALFTGSPIIGLGSPSGTSFKVDYQNNFMRFDVQGVDRFYQDNNIFMIGDTQLDVDPPNVSGSYVRFERGRDKIVNFNQFNVNLAGIGMIQVIDYNAIAEISFLNSDQTANLYIYGSNAFGGNANKLLFETGFGNTQFSVNADGLAVANGVRINEISNDSTFSTPLTASLVTGDTIKTLTQAASASALQQANNYTDTQSQEASANALVQANLYTDTKSAEASANALQQANDYTDMELLSKADEWAYTPIIPLSGTSVTLTTSIPSGAKSVEVLFKGVSTSVDNQPPIVRLGDAGGIETTGYQGVVRGPTGETPVTDGLYTFRTDSSSASDILEGRMILTRWNVDPASYYWFVDGIFNNNNNVSVFSGSKSTSEQMTTILITTPGGAATFDAGSARVRYK